MSTRLRTFGAALVINAAAALPALLVGALALQLRRDLGFGDTALGAALGLYFAVAAVCGPFGGRLAEQFGWRRALDVAAGISASVLLGIATLAHSFASLVPFLVLGGVSISLAIPTSNLVLSREMPAGRQGLLFGVKQASIPLAGLLAGLSLPVVALTIGWRWAFVAGLVVPLAAALAVPRRALGGPEPRRQHAETASMSSIATPSLVTLAVGGGLAMAGVGALNAFVVVATVDAGLDEATAGLLVALASAVGLSVRIVAGWWADRRSSGGFLPVAGLLAAGAGGFALLATSQTELVVVGTLLAYGAGWGWAGLFYFGVVTLRPDAPAAATGVVQVGLAGGIAVGPLLFGLLAGHLDYGRSWMVVTAVMLIAAWLVFRGAVGLGHHSGSLVPLARSDG